MSGSVRKDARGKSITWLGSLRGQLVIGVALVHALMMSVFVLDLTQRHEALLLERQEEQAGSLAASLAVSAAGWLAARDVAGLQELIDAQRDYPEVEFAMLLDQHGQILAHSDHARIGRYVRDLPATFETALVTRSAELVDVVKPVRLGSQPIGWVRVGVGQRVVGDRLAEITRNGMYYALAAILAGAFLAGWLGRRLTRKLYMIRDVADTVRVSGRHPRAPDLGEDEAGALAKDFNAMLDSLDQRDAEVAAGLTLRQALVKAIPDLVWLKDPDGVYLSCNPRFEQFFGAREADLVGRTDYDFVPRELADSFRANDRKAAELGQPSVNEEWITFASDGHRELVETVKTPVFTQDGALLGVLGIARDITERKRDEDLQRYAAFQSGVAEMGVSVLHNIGNAITAVVADADAMRQTGEDLEKVAALLRRGADESAARQANAGDVEAELKRAYAIQREAAAGIERLCRQGIVERGHRITRSVQHIADIVRIQQSAALPNASASSFELADVISDALAMQGDTFEKHGIEVELDLDPDMETLTLPRNPLMQALVNVLKNAREAIGERQALDGAPGRIVLRAERVASDRLRLSVTDNGIGIEPDQREQLFQFGYSTKARGSGFGLHGAALFARELGGSIELQSEGNNQGSCLALELPLHVNPAQEPVNQRTKGNPT